MLYRIYQNNFFVAVTCLTSGHSSKRASRDVQMLSYYSYYPIYHSIKILNSYILKIASDQSEDKYLAK